MMKRHGNDKHGQYRAQDSAVYRSIRMQSWFRDHRQRYWEVRDNSHDRVHESSGEEDIGCPGGGACRKRNRRKIIPSAESDDEYEVTDIQGSDENTRDDGGRAASRNRRKASGLSKHKRIRFHNRATSISDDSEDIEDFIVVDLGKEGTHHREIITIDRRKGEVADTVIRGDRYTESDMEDNSHHQWDEGDDPDWVAQGSREEEDDGDVEGQDDEEEDAESRCTGYDTGEESGVSKTPNRRIQPVEGGGRLDPHQASVPRRLLYNDDTNPTTPYNRAENVSQYQPQDPSSWDDRSDPYDQHVSNDSDDSDVPLVEIRQKRKPFPDPFVNRLQPVMYNSSDRSRPNTPGKRGFEDSGVVMGWSDIQSARARHTRPTDLAGGLVSSSTRGPNGCTELDMSPIGIGDIPSSPPVIPWQETAVVARESIRKKPDGRLIPPSYREIGVQADIGGVVCNQAHDTPQSKPRTSIPWDQMSTGDVYQDERARSNIYWPGLKQHIDSWGRGCQLCHSHRVSNIWHTIDECDRPEARDIIEMAREIDDGVVHHKSSCVVCRGPREVCNPWWRRNKVEECIYTSMMIPLAIATMLQEGNDQPADRLYEYMKAGGVDIRNKREVYSWFGRPFENRQVDISMLIFIFYVLADEHRRLL